MSTQASTTNNNNTTTTTTTQQDPAVTPSQAGKTQSSPSPNDSAAPGSSAAQPAPLPLPAPHADGESSTTVEVNGAAISLADKLGPTVVHTDGTVSRIANWAEMTEIERRNTLRVLGKRNQIRLEALRGQTTGAGTSTGGSQEPGKGGE